MAEKMVWVEIDILGRVHRIFKNEIMARTAYLGTHDILLMSRSVAVGNVREQVWYRSKGDCEDGCGRTITKNFHMHEEKHRGQGGEISVANSRALCAKCHLEGKHGNRRPKFTKRFDA